MLLAFSIAGALLLAQASPSVESVQLELKQRLSDFEKRPDKTPEMLRAIALLALDSNLRSTNFDVWVEGCASPLVPATSTCQERLWSTVKRPAAPAEQRVRAAATLVRRGDKDAVASLTTIVANLTPRDLAPVADVLRLLPAPTAVPLLRKLLGSARSEDQIVACRVMGHFDTVEAKEALRTVVTNAPPGLQPWNTCMVARARLKEPDAMLKLAGFSRAMEGEDLLDAADAMLDNGNDQGTFLLRRLTREAPGVIQLRAAEVLAAADPDAAAKVVDAKLDDPDPAVRAQALVTELRLKRTPSERVRGKLLDSDPIVQLRAAEALLQWAAAERR